MEETEHEGDMKSKEPTQRAMPKYELPLDDA